MSKGARIPSALFLWALRRRAGGAQLSLYDPKRAERDACGIGFIADSRGRSSRAVIAAALEALCRVKHRGATAADAKTGDGAGLLLPIPHRVIAPAVADPERIGVAMVFVDPLNLAASKRI